MKKVLLLLFLIFFKTSFSQNVYSGNVVLTNQQQVNDFVQGNYQQIDGFLRIDGNGNISDLHGLSSLTTISSSLIIQNNPNISNLDFLSNLSKVENLIVRNNNTLTNLGFSVGIENLKSLEIDNNDALINLENLFANTVSEFNSIKIINNEIIENISELDSIQGRLSGEIVISSNKKLENLNGLGGVTEVDYSVEIMSNTILKNINALFSLTKCRDLTIQGNPMLVSLSGLGSLTSTGFWCLIKNNDSLTDLSGLNNLQSVGQQMAIEGNENLVTFDGLSSLTSISLHFSIGGNPSLTSLEGMNSLMTIGGNLSISGNTSLTNLNSLQNLDKVITLNINNNNGLTSLSGLQGLTKIGKLNIVNNNSLENLNGLIGLNELSYGGGILTNSQKNILIDSNAILNNIDGLSNLYLVQGNLIEIKENTNLFDFCGLVNLIYSGNFNGSFNTSNNGYNPTITNIGSGECSGNTQNFAIVHPESNGYYVIGNRKIILNSDLGIPGNTNLEISYSFDNGNNWQSNGNFVYDIVLKGVNWVTPDVSTPTTFKLKINYEVAGNPYEITSDNFTVRPSNYYESMGFKDDGVSEIEFPLFGNYPSVLGWVETPGSQYHTCMDHYAKDLNYLNPLVECGKNIKAPFNAEIIHIDNRFTSSSTILCGDPSNVGAGNQIILQSTDDRTFAIKFTHLKSINDTLELGRVVNAGDIIGKVGGSGTGEITNRHLHSSLFKNIYDWFPNTNSTHGNTYTVLELLKTGDLFLDQNSQYPNQCLYSRENHSAEYEFKTVNESTYTQEALVENLQSLQGWINNPYLFFLHNFIIGINENNNSSQERSIDITSLEGLDDILSIDGDLIIQNTSIPDLKGLENLVYVGGNLTIKNNYKLTNFCALQKLIQNNGVGGEIEITNNLINPTLVELVESSCENTLSTNNEIKDHVFYVFPVPSNGDSRLQIKSNFDIQSIKIISLTGKVIKILNGNYSFINLQGIVDGLYLIEVKSNMGNTFVDKVLIGN